MGQLNFSTDNKWLRVWVAGYLEKYHWGIVRGQNCTIQHHDAPLVWELAVKENSVTSNDWLQFENFVTTVWTWRMWIQIFIENCGCEVRVGKKKSR